MQYYIDAESVRTLQIIPTETLIKKLWQTGDNTDLIRKKQKNLSSVRSSVNIDLKKLTSNGQNPDGLQLSTDNIFVMSDEAKDKALDQFLDKIPGDTPASLDEITKILQMVDGMLSNLDQDTTNEGANRQHFVTELKTVIDGITQKISSETVGNKNDVGDGDNKATGNQVGNEEGPNGGKSSDLGNCNGDGDEVASNVSETNVVDTDEIETIEDIGEDEEDEVDLEELELMDDVDEDEIIDDDKIEELEFVVNAEPDEFAGVGGETEMGGPGNPLGTAGASSNEVPRNGYDDLAGDITDQEPPDNPSADNGLDRVEALGEEDIPDWSQNPQKARLLAEEFNRSLAAMDKFYNQYVKIPAGDYTLGYKRPEGKQKPEATVQLPEYYIGKFPVTNALFELFIEKTGYQTTAEKQGFGTVYTGRSQHITDPLTGQERKIWHADIQHQTVAGACWYQPRGPGSTIHKKRNHPVVQVSLQDAMAFAAWTGKRLPSEAEWEAAARTMDGLIFPWGNAWQSHGCNVEESGISNTTPVDSYLDFVNNFGVADTLGNVLEWTSCSANGNARDTQNAYYILKGGNWVSGTDIGLYSQFQQTADGHSNLLGFRCVAF